VLTITTSGTKLGKHNSQHTSWVQEDVETQRRTSDDTEIVIEQDEPTELVEDLGSGEKGEKEVNTARHQVITAGRIVYSRRSAKKR
ncbi:hypothetical protein Tco_0541726, partial [Tanacetum coccineum]